MAETSAPASLESSVAELTTSVDRACATIDRLREQRDALVAALQAVTEWLSDQRDFQLGNGYPEEYAAVEQAKAALALAARPD